MRSNPFLPLIDRDGLPDLMYTDFSGDHEKYIIDYATIQKVKKTGEKDTDFILIDEVVEVSRTNRTDYINSFRDDVGILNILEKVRLSGDITLLNQQHRISLGASGEVDSLGRDLEPVVDVSEYQVDRVDALEKIKNTKQGYKNGLPAELADKSFEELVGMSDSDIDAYLENKKKVILAAKEAAEKGDN